MIPKIEFVYSWVYDERYRNSKVIQEFLDKNKKSYPTRKRINNYIKDMKIIWIKEGKKILKIIQKISGLKWKDKVIKCYVIGCGRPFSDPLTINILDRSKEKFIDTLTHELIHQIQTQDKRYRKWGEYNKRNYKKESVLTRNHIFLHSVHKKIMLNLYGEKRLKKEIKSSEPYPDYAKSWEIVEKEGADKIINKFKEVTK